MSLLGAVSVVLLRPDPDAPGEFINGRWVAPERIGLEIEATIEPLNDDKQIQRLERRTGQTITGGIVVFTEDSLYSVNPATKTPGDWIEWQGTTYEIVDTGTFDDSSMGYTEACAIRLEPQP